MQTYIVTFFMSLIMIFVASLDIIAMAPDATPIAIDPSQAAQATQELSSMAPPQDDQPAAVDPSAMPSVTQQATAPVTTPAAIAPATSAQLSWPDTVDLAEGEIGLAQVSNPDIINAYKQAHDAVGTMATIINQMTKTREEIYKQYFTQAALFDDCIQAIHFTKGTLQETRIDEK